MIIVASGNRDERSFDGLVVFASQFAEGGHPVGIDQSSIPTKLTSSQRYQASRFVVNVENTGISSVLVLVSGSICQEALMTLRGYNLGSEVAVVAIGRFQGDSDRIDCQLRIAYAIGRDPSIIDLRDILQKPLGSNAMFPFLGTPDKEPRAPGDVRRLCVALLPDDQIDAAALRALATLNFSRKVKLRILATRSQKEEIEASPHFALPIFEHDEFLPGAIARQTDLVAFSGAGPMPDRMLALANELLLNRRPVIDATIDATLAKTGAPVLRGPVDLGLLPRYLEETVWPNLDAICRKIASRTWNGALTVERLASLAKLALPLPHRAAPTKSGPKTVFMPTNGVGLGHARRCLLIAEEMTTKEACAFAAFPSCLPLISERGFAGLPLVQRSSQHAEPYANDIINYLRLSSNLAKGDRLVFDGGYVFNSVFRTIVENELSAVWIRRGLWQPSHVNAAAFRREPFFDQIIVPEEAFDELNQDYTFGPNVHPVGPIVAPGEKDGFDASASSRKIAAAFGRPEARIVVTMLGSGVATKREAQTHYICSLFEKRPDVLNLVVVWPGSNVSPTLYGWQNSRVVQTRDALSICKSADLVISACGYNSFHEALYHRFPTIFLPQWAPYFDDQEQRARAASNRGLAETILSTELLRLEREIRLFLDEGKAAEIRTALKATALPPRGNAAAAKIIEGPET